MNQVGNGFAGNACVGAVQKLACELEGAVEFVMNFGHDVFAVDVNGLGIGRQAQGSVEDGAVFAGVDFFAVEHGLHILWQIGCFGQSAQ